LFANDLDYYPDEADNTFHFKDPRSFDHLYRLPHWLQDPTDVFRVDADGIHHVQWSAEGNGVRIQQTLSRDAIFIATRNQTLRATIEARRQAALLVEDLNSVKMEALEGL
jgi:hypothetical protein